MSLTNNDISHECAIWNTYICRNGGDAYASTTDERLCLCICLDGTGL